MNAVRYDHRFVLKLQTQKWLSEDKCDIRMKLYWKILTRRMNYRHHSAIQRGNKPLEIHCYPSGTIHSWTIGTNLMLINKRRFQRELWLAFIILQCLTQQKCRHSQPSWPSRAIGFKHSHWISLACVFGMYSGRDALLRMWCVMIRLNTRGNKIAVIFCWRS